MLLAEANSVDSYFRSLHERATFKICFDLTAADVKYCEAPCTSSSCSFQFYCPWNYGAHSDTLDNRVLGDVSSPAIYATSLGRVSVEPRFRFSFFLCVLCF